MPDVALTGHGTGSGLSTCTLTVDREWQGIEVLDTVNPNRIQAIDDTFERRFNLLDSGVGARTEDVLEAAPASVRPFVWSAFSRAEALRIRQFVDRRKGRLNPFWLPSFQEDLTLLANVSAGGTSMSVARCGYAGRMYPNTYARRHLAVYAGARWSHHYVTSATDLLTSETLTFSPAAPRLWTAGQALICFLRLSRLEDDEVEWNWATREICQAVVQVREIPKEAMAV